MFARLGRTCYDHRRSVLAAWVLLLVVGFVIGGQVFGRLGTDQGAGGSESVTGYHRLGSTNPFGAELLAVVDGVRVDDPAVRTAVTAATADIRRQPEVARVLDPYASALPDLRARDGRAGLIRVDFVKELSDGQADRALDQAAQRLSAISPGRILLGGPHLLNREVNKQVETDTKVGEFVALPLTLLVMVFIFGGLAAAGIPFLGAIFSIAGGLLSLFGFSQVINLDPSVVSVVTVLALGLSIDYSLLIVSRYREERGLGRPSALAVERAAATAGRTIAYSALTVATSLAGLLLFSAPIFRAIGAAGVSVVVVALVAALTLVPALLGFFGGRIKAPTAPVSDDGFFARLARATQRRAVLITAGLAVVLLAAGIPFLHANFQNSSSALLPPSFASRQVADILVARFPGGSREPILVVTEAGAGGLGAYTASLRGLPGIAEVSPAAPRGAGLSVIEVLPQGEGQGATAQDVVRTLRGHRPPGRSWVTGEAAFLVDFKHDVASRMPIALGLIALATFVLLFLMTGSVLVPIKALVMNVLSLGASFGALVLVFQDGHLSGLLGFTSSGGLETWVPVIVFAFAFGLSMDYEVFLISRIKELYDAGLPNNKAVELGLQRSGRIITSAALLIVIVFAGFGAGKMLGIKEMGLALALALVVDATLVRCLLVPATMTLLGDANWWAPRPLRRLHDRFGLREAVPDPADGPSPVPGPRSEAADVLAP